MKKFFSYRFGEYVLTIAEENQFLTDLHFGGFDLKDAEKQETAFLKFVAQQLSEYFEGKRKDFDIPLSLKGTDFQLNVWRALQTIPYGETRSYKQIAEAVGCPKGFRAVGMANNKNPIGIVVPCHRVVGADGGLTGYAGGLDKKQKLLMLERKYK